MSNVKKAQNNKNTKKNSTDNKNSIIFPIIESPRQNSKVRNASRNIINERTIVKTIGKKNITNNGKRISKINNSISNLFKAPKNDSLQNQKEEIKQNPSQDQTNNYNIIFTKNTSDNKLLSNNKILKKNISAKTIDEVGKNQRKYNIFPLNVYKIILVFRNEDFYISVKPDTKIKNLRLTISKLVDLGIKQMAMVYEDKEIDLSNDDKTVNDYFDFKKLRVRPILYIKKKFMSSITDEYSPNYFKSNFNNKVKITNFPSFQSNENINNIMNNFFKNNISFNDTPREYNQYKIEKEKNNLNLEDYNCENTYIIGFPSPNLAFDFNRYINSLKIINPLYKDTKSKIISMKKRDNSEMKLRNKSNKNSPRSNLRYGIDYNLEENNLTKRNSNILRLIRKRFLQRKELKKEKNKSQLYINASGPYLSSFDKDIIEQKENKKKWINPEGFISCVGKYSGVQL